MPYHPRSISQSPSQRDCFTSPLADAHGFRTHWPRCAAIPQFLFSATIIAMSFCFLGLGRRCCSSLAACFFLGIGLAVADFSFVLLFCRGFGILGNGDPFLFRTSFRFFVLRPRMAEASPREEVLAMQYAPQRNRKMWLMVPKTCACHLNSSGVIGGATSAALVQYSAPAIATMTQRPATFAGCEPAGKRSRATATRCVSANASITFCALKLNVDTIG